MKNTKKFNNILIVVFSLLSILYFIRDVNIGRTDRFLSDLTLTLVLLLPRIFKIKMSDRLETLYLVFAIFADFFGSIVNLYNRTWWYDLFAHFVSGILTSILAIMIINHFELNKNENKFFNILFIISFTMLIASLWEFVEFGSDCILHLDVQHNLTTGVRDTM